MNKRKIAECESDTSYVVIEITDKNGITFVQFIPRSWLKPLKPNSEIMVRAMAQFYFPRRLPGQSINQHSKFVKNAKFIGMQPENNNNWEILQCRVLKLGLGCIDDAITAEKMFSDYFDTTEAEKELQRELGPPVKRIRKVRRKVAKKVQIKVSSDRSDSENESAGATEGISNYNDAFKTIQDINLITTGEVDLQLDDPNPDTETICLEEAGLQLNHQNRDEHIQEEQPVYEQPLMHFVQNDDAQLYPEGSVFQLLDQAQLQIQNELATAQHPQISSNGCDCKGLEKLRNKIDYFQRRIMTEMAEFRHDVTKSIRNLTDIVLRKSNGEPNQDEQEREDVFDDLSGKYKQLFPVDDKTALRSIDRSIKKDADLKMFLELKLERMYGKEATKIARKMLNSLCTVKCFSQFTWGGNPKLSKDCFSNLQSLIEVTAKILEKKFPKCGAFNIIESVVKQRTKSAGEAMKENIKASTVPKDAAAINVNQTLDTVHLKENVLIINNNGRDTTAVNVNQESVTVPVPGGYMQYSDESEADDQGFDPNSLINCS